MLVRAVGLDEAEVGRLGVDHAALTEELEVETVCQPMRVRGNGSERMVFAFEGFSLPDDKQLEVTIHERNGGRTLSFRVQNEDLLRARRIDHLKLQWR